MAILMMFKELKSKNVQNSLRYYIRAGSLTAPPVFAILRRSAAVLIAQHSARRVTQPLADAHVYRSNMAAV